MFDTQAYSLCPQQRWQIYKLIQEYFWVCRITPAIVQAQVQIPPNIEKDILGKKVLHNTQGTVLKNGMVVTFSGNYVIQKLDPKDDKRFIVEGVCEGIILHNKEQNFATVFSTEDYIPMTQQL